MKKIIQDLLDRSRTKYRVSFCDIRYKSLNEETIQTTDDVLKHYLLTDSVGVGIRVLKNGRWGFCATDKLDPISLDKALKRAVEISESGKNIGTKDIILTKEKSHIGHYQGPYKIDPFKISPEEKMHLLFELDKKAKTNPLIKKTDGLLLFWKHHQLLMNTEGSVLKNEYVISSGSFDVQAVGNGGFQNRRIQERPKMAGYEWVLHHFDQYDILRLCDEAIMKLNSTTIPKGKKDLIILPSNLFLTMHESVGHPTELDRVLGWEADFAGTSFATTEKLGKFQYGSPIVNFRADNTVASGLSSKGWDDDGVPAQKWDIIKNGKLVNYGTTREVAHYIGKNQSYGCNFASTWQLQPINRIPNLFLLPGKEKLSLKDLIADTEDGLIIDGRDSYSIDQKRYNFQFSGNFVREIKNGKLGEVVRNLTYRSISPDFWNSCDKICDHRFFEYWGVLNCGKGQPAQRHTMIHGSAPARFKNINVGD